MRNIKHKWKDNIRYYKYRLKVTWNSGRTETLEFLSEAGRNNALRSLYKSGKIIQYQIL